MRIFILILVATFSGYSGIAQSGECPCCTEDHKAIKHSIFGLGPGKLLILTVWLPVGIAFKKYKTAVF